MEINEVYVICNIIIYAVKTVLPMFMILNNVHKHLCLQNIVKFSSPATYITITINY